MTGTLLGAGACLLLIGSALVAFRGWPSAAASGSVGRVVVPDPVPAGRPADHAPALVVTGASHRDPAVRRSAASRRRHGVRATPPSSGGRLPAPPAASAPASSPAASSPGSPAPAQSSRAPASAPLAPVTSTVGQTGEAVGDTLAAAGAPAVGSTVSSATQTVAGVVSSLGGG